MLGTIFARGQEEPKQVADHSTLHVFDMLNAAYTDQDMQVGGYQPILRTVKPPIPVSYLRTTIVNQKVILKLNRYY